MKELREPTLVVPDYVEPLEAWRVWRVGLREARVVLHSAYADERWEPGVPLGASCPRRHRLARRPWRTETAHHHAPDLACSCGIYGVRSLAAARWFLESEPSLRRADRVIGRVALWGDVVVCEWGWRASFGYPLQLFVPAPTPLGRWRRTRLEVEETLDALETYRVPVDVLPTAV